MATAEPITLSDDGGTKVLSRETWLAERARIALAMLRDTVSIDPDIMGGVPVLKGTRFPIPQLIAEIADGKSVDNLARTFSLDLHQIQDFLHGLAIHLDQTAPERTFDQCLFGNSKRPN